MIPQSNRRNRRPLRTHPWTERWPSRDEGIVPAGPLGLDIECRGWRRDEEAMHRYLRHLQRLSSD